MQKHQKPNQNKTPNEPNSSEPRISFLSSVTISTEEPAAAALDALTFLKLGRNLMCDPIPHLP